MKIFSKELFQNRNISLLLNRIVVFFAVFGPATITAMSDNDAAGVATYSLLGAKFGYSILFVLFLVTILLAITQEMGVRIAIVSGKGLGDLIRERYGVKLSLIVFTCLLFANMGTIIANFSAIKVTANMFNLPVLPLIIGIIIISFLFISKGNYKTNQNIFLISSLFYFSYVISAMRGNPDWGTALKSIVVPTNIPLTKEFVFASIAILGTTITPWGQFFIHSFIIDKKLSLEKLKYSQIETFFGALLTDFFSFFMIVATAATLFVHKISLISGEQAALAIKPFAGEMASVLFAIGIMNAGFMGLVIISLSTAYAFSEFFGIEGSLDVPYERGKLFYTIFLLQLLIAGFIVLLPFISLFKIVLYTQSLNGIMLPVIFYFLLKIINDKNLMGNHTNPKVYNYFAIISSIVIISASLFTLVTSIFH
jgi:NRAMP (natural resistance-associated macrophage protein)-like metal ion transporter